MTNAPARIADGSTFRSGGTQVHQFGMAARPTDSLSWSGI
jgi:hypothetical protein